MKAAVIPEIGRIEVREQPDPKPQAGEAVVAIQAAALNHRDVWIKTGQYAGLKFPCIPGSDGAGIELSTGREVILYPALDWGASEAAQGADFSILGLPRDGTLAERVVVPAAQLAPKPAHLDWAEAAALPLAGLTAYRAVCVRGALRGRERVLVTGIGGGVALFALQFAVAMGAEVWVTSSSPGKLKRAAALGARGGFDYTQEGWAAAALKVSGPFDLIIDSAGGPGFDSLIDLAAPGGRIVFFGATRGNPPGLAMRKVFWRQLSILGTTMGSPADWKAMTAFVATHRIKPVVSHIFTFDKTADAFALMEKGEQFGKIVVEVATG